MKRDYFFTDENNAFRDSVRRFVQKEITPKIDEWEEKGCYDKTIFKRMGELGLLGLSYPPEYGGQGADIRMTLVFWEELCRCGALGFPMSVMVHTDMASPSLAHAGSDKQKDKYLRPVCSGEKLMAVAMTEPNHGSDVASIETRAVLEGNFYRVNGTKMFITNGPIAEVMIILAVTDKEKKGAGISAFVVEKNAPGFSVGRALKKMANSGSRRYGMPRSVNSRAKASWYTTSRNPGPSSRWTSMAAPMMACVCSSLESVAIGVICGFISFLPLVEQRQNTLS